VTGTVYSFLFGARRTGESYWINHNFNTDEIILIDLLQINVFAEYASGLLWVDHRLRVKSLRALENGIPPYWGRANLVFSLVSPH